MGLTGRMSLMGRYDRLATNHHHKTHKSHKTHRTHFFPTPPDSRLQADFAYNTPATPQPRP